MGGTHGEVLDLVKDQWEKGDNTAQNVVKQVVEIREGLASMQTLAQQALRRNQMRQKERYDGRVRMRSITPG